MEFPVNIALVALSVLGLGSLAYLVFCKDKEDEDDQLTVTPKNFIEVELKVPTACVGIVIGRQGSNIKQFESNYSCKINFNDSRNANEEFRICRIRGDADSVRAAEIAIHELIANQPLIETFEMKIPGKTCGRIIGKGGDTIRSISMNSNAKITISRDTLAGDQRQVVITGTADQIAAARLLLGKKLIEEQEFESRVEQSVSSRSPRHTPKYLLAEPANGDVSSAPTCEKLVSTGSDGLLEVFASAIHSPDRVWLQMKGPSTVELDRLNDTMTTYYGKPESRIINALTEVRVGQLVAAPFMFDPSYYRAEVDAVIETEDGSGVKLDLYYIDYGDSAECPMDKAFQLNPEFLKLRIQAIECILARVKPREDRWSEEASDRMEELTHVALWKPLTARIYSYRTRPTRGRRGGSPVPCVDLYDTSGPQEIDVAKCLVDEGFARWEETGNGFTTTSEDSTLNDNPVA